MEDDDNFFTNRSFVDAERFLWSRFFATSSDEWESFPNNLVSHFFIVSYHREYQFRHVIESYVGINLDTPLSPIQLSCLYTPPTQNIHTIHFTPPTQQYHLPPSSYSPYSNNAEVNLAYIGGVPPKLEVRTKNIYRII